MARLMKTISGASSRAIWVDEPNAISIATSIWFRSANRTADACSAALPMMATTNRPTKTRLRPSAATVGSSESTRNSDMIPTTRAAASSTSRASHIGHSAFSSVWRTPKRWVWVIRVKTRAARRMSTSIGRELIRFMQSK